MTRRLLIGAAVLVLTGCGGSKGGGTSTPTSPTPQQNRAPTISSVTVTPTFGIAEIHEFRFSALASDPDGDSLTYTWDLAGNPMSGQNPSISFRAAGGGGNYRGTVSVSDGKGGTATGNADFTLGSMSATWRMIMASVLDGSTYQLTQTATIVTGTLNIIGIGAGNLDPAQPGTIGADGRVTLRCKVGRFGDYTLNGTMDTTGRRITGGVTGSGFNGQTFVLVQQ